VENYVIFYKSELVKRNFSMCLRLMRKVSEKLIEIQYNYGHYKQNYSAITGLMVHLRWHHEKYPEGKSSFGNFLNYHIIVLLGVHCDIYKSAYTISTC
jgi:hypothetical protein